MAETAKERRMWTNNEERVETIEEIDQLLFTNEVVIEKFNNGGDIQVTSTSQFSQMKPQNNKKKKVKTGIASKLMVLLNE